MKNSLDEIYRNDERREEVKKAYERRAAIPADKSSHFKPGANGSSSVFKSCSKAQLHLTKNHELCNNFQAFLLASYILVLSYNGVFHGRSEYSILENGQTFSGLLPSDSTVVTLSFGYSAPYSIVSTIAAIMLLYSLASKEACWSLPSMVLCMADLICDVGDAVVAIWLFFASLRMTTAILYSVGTVVVIRALSSQSKYLNYNRRQWGKFFDENSLSDRVLDLAGSPAAVRAPHLVLILAII